MVSGRNGKKAIPRHYFFISVTAGEENSVEHKQPLQD